MGGRCWLAVLGGGLLAACQPPPAHPAVRFDLAGDAPGLSILGVEATGGLVTPPDARHGLALVLEVEADDEPLLDAETGVALDLVWEVAQLVDGEPDGDGWATVADENEVEADWDELAGRVFFRDALSRGQRVRATLTAVDRIGEGARWRATVDVANAPPTASLRAPESVRSTEEVVVELVSSDADGDPVTLESAALTVDGATAPAEAWSFDGDDAVRVAAAATDKGQRWSVQVVATDGTAQAVASASFDVGNATPTLDGATLTVDDPDDALGDGACTVASTLRIELVDAADADGDDLEAVVTWLVDDEPLEHTGATLDASQLVRGDTVRASVVASDGQAVSEAVDLPGQLLVVNARPTVDRAEVVQPLVAGSDATCDADTSDPDRDTLTRSVAWFVGGAKVLGVSGDTLPASRFLAGDEVACEVTAFDGTRLSDPLRSAPVVAEAP